MINCEKATYLVEKRQLSKLSFREKFGLKFHNLICRLCRHYESDSNILGKLLRSSGKRKPSRCLSEEEKARLKSSLDQQA